MLNPAEIEALSRGLFPEDYQLVAPPDISSAEGSGIIGRIGEQAANLPSNTINELLQSFIGFGQMFAPEQDRMSVEALQAFKPVPQFFDVAPATTTGEKVVDFLGADVAPSLAAAVIPYVGASRALKAVSTAGKFLSPTGIEALSQGFAGGLSGAQLGPEQAGIGAAIGTLGGVTEKLSRAARILPSLGIGAVEFVGQQTIGDMSAKDAAIMSTVDVLANMLPGKIAHAPGAPGLLPHEFPIRSSENLATTAIYNPPQWTHGNAQGELSLALNPTPERRFSMELEPRVTPPAIDTRQLSLNTLRLQQVLDGRKPDWNVDNATLFDLDKYPITRNFELVDPPRTLQGDARGGVPHLKLGDDPTQMNLDDLILRKAMQDLEAPVATAKSVEVGGTLPPKPAVVAQQKAPKKVKLKSDAIEAKAVEPVLPKEPTIKRMKDFETEGKYEVTLTNGVKKEIFRDPESTNWYETKQDKDGHWVLASTTTKKDAVARLQTKYGKEAPKPAAPATKIVEGGPVVERAPGHKISGEYKVTLPNGKATTVLRNDDGHWILKPTEQGYDALPGGVLTKEKGMAALKKAVLEHNKSGVFDTPKPAVEDILEKAFGVPKGSEKMSQILKRMRSPDSTEAGTVVQELLLSVGAGVAAGGGVYAQTKDPIAALTAGLAAAGLAAGGLRKINKVVEPSVPTKMSVHDYVPALNINGKIVRGQKGDTHLDIMNRHMDENPNDADAFLNFDTKENPNLFYRGEEVITREQLKVDLGVSDSQGLRALQNVDQQIPVTMKLGGDSLAAFIGGEAITSLAGASAGAAYGYAKEGTVDSAVGYAMVGAGLGFLGVKALKKLQAHQGPTIKAPKTAKPLDESVREKLVQFAVDTAKTPGGIAVAGRGGMLPHSVRTAESWLGLNMPWLAKEAKLRAEGLISDVVSGLQDSIDAVKKIVPSPAFIQKASLYLKGQLAPEQEVIAVLRKHGAVTQDDWDKMLPLTRNHLSERWMVKADPTNTNTKGDNITIWRTTNTGKSELAALQEAHLARAVVTPDDRVFMQLPIKARETINTIQGIVLDAIPNDVHGRGLRNKLMGTFDQYQTRTFEMFTDKSYYPTEVAIANRMKRVAEWTEDNFLKKANVVKIATVGYQEVRPGVWIPDAEAKAFKELYTDLTLRQDVEHEIVDYKRNKASFSKSMGESSDMDASLLGTRKELTPDLRELLGEHKNVTDEIVHTMNRLTGTAQAAKMITLMADARMPNGMRMAYDQAAFIAEENGLRQILTTSTDARVIREAQNKLEELKSYIPTGDDPRLGLFGNKRVSRFAHDQLKDYRSPWGIFESPMGRTISQANNYMKMVHAPYSPITQVRNMISIPAFLAIGRASNPAALKTAFDLLTNKSHPLWGRMRQLGIVNATQSHGEFKYGMHELVNGAADGKIMGLGRRVHKTVLDTYAKPDLFVRIATFLSAEKRFAKQNPGWSKADVESAALKFTDRRTMDYNNMPAAIKTIRQVPFVNMYISYAYEALRIMKNMGEDAVQGDIHAGATLAAIATVPFILQASMENSLTPEQRKKWNRTNNLSADYSRTRFKLPTGRTDAKGNMYYFDITPLNVIDNYAQMVRGASRGDWAAVGATNPLLGWENTPMFTIMAAQIAGRDLRTHRDFRGLDDRFTDILRQTLPSFTPGIGYEAQKITPAALGGTLGVTNLKTGRTDEFSSFVSKMLTGMNYTSINPGVVLQNAKRELDNNMKLEKQYLNDVLKSTAPLEAKQRAVRNFQESAKVYMHDFMLRTNAES